MVASDATAVADTAAARIVAEINMRMFEFYARPMRRTRTSASRVKTAQTVTIDQLMNWL